MRMCLLTYSPVDGKQVKIWNTMMQLSDQANEISQPHIFMDRKQI
jgi:hypothetical protein